MTAAKADLRIRNPFLDPLVTELIEDPDRYRQMFSEHILVGETLQVFQPANVVLLGPQGSGKSMILNLVRHSVLAKWINGGGELQIPLGQVPPYLGISINLVRANFHSFGRRSVSRARTGSVDENIDATCAADYLTHYLFREYLHAIRYLTSDEGYNLLAWLRISVDSLESAAKDVAAWNCWFGYYSQCDGFGPILARCEERLDHWRSFLNANVDDVDRGVWNTKASLEPSLHAMGNLLRRLGTTADPVSLFVVIDQYEVLPELVPAFGTTLQRIVNSVIKARDPVVSYKIGARTYDWGNELRVWGANSKIEVQRDYSIIDLSTVLKRTEDSPGIFADFAKDVANKRFRAKGYDSAQPDTVARMLGDWDRDAEGWIYFGPQARQSMPERVMRRVDANLRHQLSIASGEEATPLDLRLAEAWFLQRQARGEPQYEILQKLAARRLGEPWWRKERIELALLQIASAANQKKRYYGWRSILGLSGSNISAFLLLCSEIWDQAAKLEVDPTEEKLSHQIQTAGVFAASTKWRERDQGENPGGRKRYEIVGRLADAIHRSMVDDNPALSNPGHSGFSIKEEEIWAIGLEGATQFLFDAVSWAILEERPHTSKEKSRSRRRKFYLHPLLSPFFAIPYTRVKEPYYSSLAEVNEWLVRGAKVGFRKSHPARNSKQPAQLDLSMEDMR